MADMSYRERKAEESMERKKQLCDYLNLLMNQHAEFKPEELTDEGLLALEEAFERTPSSAIGLMPESGASKKAETTAIVSLLEMGCLN